MLTISIIIAAILGVITGKYAYLYTSGNRVNINAQAKVKG